MKKIATLLLFSIAYTLANAQSPVITFDGVDDYVDLGPDAGNEVRTVELWFNSSTNIDSSLSTAKTLFVRDHPYEDREFGLTFSQVGWANPGKLRFYWSNSTGGSTQYNLYSNSNQWSEDIWHHVAVVMDSVQGGKMFIDGIEQISNEPSMTQATLTSTSNTVMGKWGDFSIRYFTGKIDDLRFSSTVLYDTDFTPPCPDLMVTPTTIGLWNFNENAGGAATDSSPNNYNGQIFGATWDTATICATVGFAAIDFNSETLKPFPNPSKGKFHFINSSKSNSIIVIYNSFGQMIMNQKATIKDFDVNIEDRPNGIYYYKIVENGTIIQSGKLIKI